MLPQNENFHALEDSSLYKLTSVNRLAKLLFSSVDGLNALAKSNDRYRSWDEPKKKGGFRRIEAPYDNLKAIQKRISDLLLRIEPPVYLMAPVKKRSYVDNAALHAGSKSFCLLDVEDFFPSCTDKKVYWFFNKRMKCAPHVSALLKNLITYDGHLPQGSPCSPIMAYLAYSDMWNEINVTVKSANCKLSIYADDITISGNIVYLRDIWKIKQILHRHGHKYSEKKERHLVHKPADITGVIVSGNTLLLPNRQHLKITQLKKKSQKTTFEREKQKLSRQLKGRYAQAKQIQKYVL